MQLVLNSYGLQLSQRNRCFQIESKTGNRIISPARISSILITKNMNISSSAILLAVENNIPIVLVDNIGNPVVKINPLLSSGLTALRKKQLLFSRSKDAHELVKQMLLQKTEGHIANLSWWANRKTSVAATCITAKEQILKCAKKLETHPQSYTTLKSSSDFLRGWEAISAKYYWQAVAKMASLEGMPMQGRSYRPAKDEYNAAINYLYGMLYNQVETGLACAGLDSQIGLWHRDQYQTPSLAFDAIEPLRPKIDRLLMEVLMQQKIVTKMFEPNSKYGFLLKKEGRMVLISAFNDHLEERIKMNGQVTAFKNHILQIANNIKLFIEKIKSDDAE